MNSVVIASIVSLLTVSGAMTTREARRHTRIERRPQIQRQIALPTPTVTVEECQRQWERAAYLAINWCEDNLQRDDCIEYGVDHCTQTCEQEVCIPEIGCAQACAEGVESEADLPGLRN